MKELSTMQQALLEGQRTDERRVRLMKSLPYLVTFVGVGMMMSSLGPTLPGLEAQTQSTTAQVSILITLRSFGSLVGALVIGRVYDRVAGHPLLAGALIGTGAILALTPLIPSLLGLGALFVVLGLMEATLQVGGNTSLIWLHRDKVAPYTNALAFAFGVGSFIAPILIAQLTLATGGIQAAYWALALCMLPPAFWIIRQPSPQSPAKALADARRETPANVALHRPHALDRTEWRPVIAIVAFVLLIVGVEASMAGLLTTYGLNTGLLDEAGGAYLTSAFFAALTGGRLLGVGIAMRLRPRTILLVDLIGAVLSALLVALLPESPAPLWLGVIGMGLFTASLFPTILAMAQRRMALPARVTSLFFAGAAGGAMIVPWLIAQFFTFVGPGALMWGAVICLLLELALYRVLLSLLERR
jgi:MFS transporter, FHS family, Na+ dependent glucose transporter 1